MKYEVLTIKKSFRYYATVMATPDKWWEKYVLFKRTKTLKFQGRKGMWFDDRFSFAQSKIAELIDHQFEQQYGFSPFAYMGLIAVFAAAFLGMKPPTPEP
jgi:hypothetical protein